MTDEASDIGERLIDAIIAGSLFHADGNVVVWSANAPSQLGSFVQEHARNIAREIEIQERDHPTSEDKR